MRRVLIASALLVACGGSGPSSPVEWSIRGPSITCSHPDQVYVLPVSGPPESHVCIWWCVAFEGQPQREVEAWFDTADGGASWTFRRTYSSPAQPANCQ